MTENCKLRKAILSAFYNISQRNFGILLILWCSFKLCWNFCLDLFRSKFSLLRKWSIRSYDIRKHGLVLIGRNVFRTCEIIVSRFWLVDVNLERAFHINKTVRKYQYLYNKAFSCTYLDNWLKIIQEWAGNKKTKICFEKDKHAVPD
jgi:hypothetical protein